ncbi:hypothetical protein RJ640_014977 [Escallonia rubra]|uniref:non-specific serine/threonine protein kinase n=1 Tax=Escallonia rubra TaxID=112253 RepID=A0AA88UCA9_9ASTE|nr:hypothetical protein RJ640_014977 [Escallonia rubra]
MNCRGSVAAAGFTNETDRRALLAFKDLIQEDPFAVLSSWNDSLHFCEWNGVTCGRQHQRVTALRLVSQNLVGSVSPQIGRLTFLRKIHLNNNSFHGNIPPDIGQLFRLQTLLLYNNSFQENRLHGHLPLDLGLTLPNLKYLYLGANKFSGSFPPSMANASGLLELSMSVNHFVGPIPMNLGNLRDLEILELNENRFGSNKPDDLSFIASLTNCTNLRNLILYKNQFGGVLPGSLANLSSKLDTLLLGFNKISGSIPQEIGNLNLYHLNIDGNMISGSIPESIGKLSKLQRLLIKVNNISGKIPPSIGNITGLSLMIASENMLEGSIPAELGNCTNLQALYLGSNRLTGVIPEQVIGISSLSIGLYLDLNEFTGPIPSQVGNLKNLGALSIRGNKLTGEIPSALGSCQVLEYLDLQGNFLNGTIPSSLDQLKGIQQLDLSQNNMSGQIPEFLGKLPLMHLNLSHNMFEGEVPKVGVFNNISAFSVVGKNMKLCGGIQPLHLPACPIKFSKKNKRAFSDKMIPFIIILPIVLLLACLFFIFYRLKRSQQRTSSASLLENQYPKITYAELLHATNEFSPSNLIGEGRYGSVYKGSLNSGEHIVAVKVLKLQECGANKSFMAECDVLRILRHRNLIKIITVCSSLDFKGKDFKALVFEFMPNGSLDSWLHPTQAEEQGSNLTLVQRLSIAIDVASALDYIHHHCEMTISHCDLKPSNVLLDDDLCAHVEYGMGEKVSTEADMYSYGIMLLEMFTGKRPTDSMFIDNFSLHNYVKFALPGRVMEIVDSTIIHEEVEGLNRNRGGEGEFAKLKSCLESILRLGVICSAELPHERMDSGNVVKEVHRITKAYNE